jgi:hypothetical protein
MRDALAKHMYVENDSGTYYFEITTFLRTVLWALKGTSKMEWRIVHHLDADIVRPICIIAILVIHRLVRRDLQKKNLNLGRTSNFLGYPT